MRLRLYKVLRRDGTSPYVGYPWPLPSGRCPGRWVTASGAPDVCANGLHLLKRAGLTDFPGPRLYVVEAAGEKSFSLTVVSARRARLLRRVESWNERALISWLCDCVEHATNLAGEDAENADSRYERVIATARSVIAAARALVLGGASKEDVIQLCLPSAWWNALRMSTHKLVHVVSGPNVCSFAVETLDYARMAAAAGVSSVVERDRTEAAEARWQHQRMLTYIGKELRDERSVPLQVPAA